MMLYIVAFSAATLMVGFLEFASTILILAVLSVAMSLDCSPSQPANNLSLRGRRIRGRAQRNRCRRLRRFSNGNDGPLVLTGVQSKAFGSNMPHETPPEDKGVDGGRGTLLADCRNTSR
ncbi:hypothetical protein J8I87_36370 [Paraburkholderia sp. LEh10]|uniref:hypothetical protein n=1 Tax=Paraburkholderia sp. LEh10 TaxID=2821353 RepID=UPI001AE5B2DF|nr:hypothetical protein [Paraburkholderia sp. LEh10]MBP0595041.1 hypothetical protein [Paraburkholderia sp. LEh10]